MIYSHFNELHRYNQKRRADRIHNALAKLFIAGLVVYVLLGVV